MTSVLIVHRENKGKSCLLSWNVHFSINTEKNSQNQVHCNSFLFVPILGMCIKLHFIVDRE